MNLLDDSNARNLESSLETMTPAHDTHTGASAVIDAPEHAQPSLAEPLASAPDAHGNDAHENGARENGARENETPENVAPDNSAHETAAAGSDDFAAALQNFETETEESVGDDHVIKGTVVKLTATHVVVDIGTKSEGMVPIAEVLDHEGKPKFQPGDEIDVMRDKGETEEGYVNLSHLKAQRLRSWDEIERAYNEKKPIKGIVVERIKGGLTIDIQGARYEGPDDGSRHHQAQQEARQHCGLAQTASGRRAE
jgi:small subunit ribosomal protein S1